MQASLDPELLAVLGVLQSGERSLVGVRLGLLLVGGGNALRRLDRSLLASHFFGQSSFVTHSVVPYRGLVPVGTSLPLDLLGAVGMRAVDGGRAWR
ncbi:hypothetical protein [Lentzea sp. NPDC051838]|uniref:hypothetical protein n=1 Tax=Lentzea sp. NPDC051838 TaxID=3154849 RepID=UPI00342A47EC